MANLKEEDASVVWKQWKTIYFDSEDGICLDLYKEKKAVTNRCVNCHQDHHAWNPACPERLRRVQLGKTRQAEWIREQQQTSTTPAPGTFIWGSQSQSPPQPQPPLRPHLGEHNFPPLPAAVTPTPTSLPMSPTHQPAIASPRHPQPMPQPPPPPQPPHPPNTLLITPEILQSFAKNLTVAVAQVFQTATGVTIDIDVFEKVADKLANQLVSQVVEKAQALTTQHNMTHKAAPSP
ncbi:hypothetical protein E2C01_035926 [Portunus trituberculatus]|uniref:Uncharacterized protein n=1 Tax=Portunus trituberculatus TaxID=210409 RepID=A0A5B7F9S9_PORTR|nr:hypothetical protein [Portunus trituberculatus]